MDKSELDCVEICDLPDFFRNHQGSFQMKQAVHFAKLTRTCEPETRPYDIGCQENYQ
ncbi:hypothetical protein GOV12_04950 [Candidatus Pacearchaeota archaeon]|nr:hypothetical protein [Candidatus Pacearchaeota archaeon]